MRAYEVTVAELPPLLADDDQLLKPREAARLLRVSEQTMRQWRREKRGPPYRKHGNWLVYYSLQDLRAWSAANTAA